MNTEFARSKSSKDWLDPARAAALHLALDCEGDPPKSGDPLPDFWHHIYFWEPTRPDGAGLDGHPLKGDFIPDLGLPRRMWAGGRYGCETPLLLGEVAEKFTAIKNISRKSGRSGALAFVELEHEFRQAGRVALRETQNLVYREASRDGAQAPNPPVAPEDESRSRRFAFDSVALFRFSALTLNCHRIHYDADYCREVEGYPGLVVHSPLQSACLVGLATSLLGRMREFEYRGTAPLFCGETADFCAREGDGSLDLWVRGPEGRLCMTATAK